VNRLFILGVAIAAGGLSGCASTWDAVTSRDFRKAPFKSTFSSDDPMTVLRTKVDGDARAKAMRKLQEPAAGKGSAAEQDEALQILGQAATSDPSPVLRIAAVDALGRFKDPRALPLLFAAYHKADGMDDASRRASGLDGDLTPVAGRGSVKLDPYALTGPAGNPPEFVFGVRAKVIDALAASDRPEAVKFLADVATGQAQKETDPDDQKVRVAAVRGLGRMRHKESVVALAKVLQSDGKKDILMADEAHKGLVDLTGKKLPADGDKWAEVIQAGFVVQPEQSSFRRALGSITP
jgi:HEAT repeats/PBS lyase HEAT-like repeat